MSKKFIIVIWLANEFIPTQYTRNLKTKKGDDWSVISEKPKSLSKCKSFITQYLSQIT